jgi:MYXO-CTERM domain-containing protein
VSALRASTKLLVLGALGAASLPLFAGCSTAPKNDLAERYDRVSSGIQCTNCTDTTHKYAVGIDIGGQGSCSGTLIAPNLVLTARHCVTSSPGQIDCATSNFPQGNYPANTFTVTTNVNSPGSPSYGVSQVITPAGAANTKCCGHDIALLILSSNVTGVTPATPLVQYSMTDHDRVNRAYPPTGFAISTTYVAIGYGNNGTSGAGTRRIMTNVNLLCIPGDPVQDCGNLANANLDQNEWAGGNGVCPGDSGGGAYEQTSFNQNPSSPIVFGIAVRAGQQNGNCVGSAYTRTDVWSDLIINAAKLAAQAGGYSPPAWTQPVPPDPDAGTTSKDGSATNKDGGSSSSSKSLGEPCGSNEECSTGSCAALGDSAQVCTQPCDDATNKCPDGFTCKSGYCFAGSSGPPPPAAQPTTTTTTSGCNVAPDPNNPVPWKGAALAALLGLAVTRRRRS